MIKENQKVLNKIFILIDVLIISFSLLLGWLIRFHSNLFNVVDGYLGISSYLMLLIFLIPIYLLIYSFFDLYISYRSKTIYIEISKVLKSNIIGLLIIITGLFIIKEINYSRLVLFLFFFFLINTSLTIIERIIIRIILRNLRKKGYNLKHIIIVGTSDLAAEFIQKLKKIKFIGYNILGIFDDNKKKGSQFYDFPVINKIEKMAEYVEEKNVNEVIIALPLEEYDKLSKIINICEKYGIRAKILPDYNKYIPADPYIDEIDGLQLIKIRHVPLDNFVNKYSKRLFDIFSSLAAIIILSPVMIVIALIIKFTSPGPVLFEQIRVGKENKNFKMYKFRSMRPQSKEISATKWTTEDDPRITKIGKFIRKTSLDELPQLFNVLKGNMSLVGPRPERPHFVEKFKEDIPKYMVKHQVPPGITG